MTRETSRECTANQIHVALVRGNKGASGSFSGRLSELRELGVIFEVGTVVCPVTGRNVIQWSATDSLPKEIKKEKRVKCEHCAEIAAKSLKEKE